VRQFKVTRLSDLSAAINKLQTAAKLGFQHGLPEAYLAISRESLEQRSNDQNKKFHALIRDISNTAKVDKKYSQDVWKALLVDAFEQELKSQGEELPKPSKVALSFDGQRAVSIRPSTTSFNKAIGAKFIEFLYVFGVENGATFSRESVSIFERATVEVHE
jgi:hypothetical protein